MDKLGSRFRGLKGIAGGALGVAGVAGAFIALKRVIGSVVTVGAELEQALTGAVARFQIPIAQRLEVFEALEEKARAVGRATEFTSVQAGQGLNFFAKAGFSANQAVALLGPTVDFATAAEMGLARAADIATDSIGAFGLGSKDAGILADNFGVLSDKMAKSVNIANVTLEGMFETIKLGAVTTRLAGLPVTDFIALTAELAQSGLKGSRAGTSINNAFVNLAKTANQRKLKRLGVIVTDKDTGRMRDFADIMDELGVGLEKRFGNRQDKKLAFLQDVFGLRGFRAIGLIVQSGTERFRRFRHEIENSTGAMRELAKQLRDTRQGEIKRMEASFEGFALALSGAGDKEIGGVIGFLTEFARAGERFTAAHPGIVRGLVLIFGAIAGGLVLGGGLFLIALAVTALFGAIAAGGAAAAAALVGIGVAVAATGVLIGKWVAELDTVKESLGFRLIARATDFFTGGGYDFDNPDPFAVQTPVDRFIEHQRAERGDSSQTFHQLTIANETGFSVSLDNMLARRKPAGFGVLLRDSGGFEE